MNREEKIRKLAYVIYKIRNHRHGSKLGDWFRAEKIISWQERLYTLLRPLPQICVVIGLVVSIWIGMSTNARTDLNIELANRPFISIESPYWWRIENTDWFGSAFKMKNYGNKPSEDFKIRNFRVVLFRINNEHIKEKIRDKMTAGQEQYFDEYFLDEKNKVSEAILARVSEYFKISPDSDKSAAQDFLNSIKNVPLLTYKNGVVFDLVEVNNDMSEYYDKKGHLTFPNQPEGRGLTEQMGRGAINGVFSGDNLLIIYWAIQYRGFKKDKYYSTFYIGYSDQFTISQENSVFKADDGKVCYMLREFQSWQTEEKIILRK